MQVKAILAVETRRPRKHIRRRRLIAFVVVVTRHRNPVLAQDAYQGAFLGFGTQRPQKPFFCRRRRIEFVVVVLPRPLVLAYCCGLLYAEILITIL